MRLASRWRMLTLRAEHERAVARAVAESGEPLPAHPNHVLPGDHRRLRGIPVVGVKGGLGGAIPGSRPGQNLYNGEAR